MKTFLRTALSAAILALGGHAARAQQGPSTGELLGQWLDATGRLAGSVGHGIADSAGRWKDDRLQDAGTMLGSLGQAKDNAGDAIGGALQGLGTGVALRVCPTGYEEACQWDQLTLTPSGRELRGLIVAKFGADQAQAAFEQGDEYWLPLLLGPAPQDPTPAPAGGVTPPATGPTPPSAPTSADYLFTFSDTYVFMTAPGSQAPRIVGTVQDVVDGGVARLNTGGVVVTPSDTEAITAECSRIASLVNAGLPVTFDQTYAQASQSNGF